MLSAYGDCDIAIDGNEAVEAFMLAWRESKPYDLICMDIMMPNMDGHHSLGRIREIEKEMEVRSSKEAKVIMTTALDDPKNVFQALNEEGATSYIVKPISKNRLLEELYNLGLTGVKG